MDNQEKDKKNKCSVITVTLNNSLGLRITLQSLCSLKQRPFEVIVIDGKSSDDTVKVIESYKKLINIKFFSEKDSGIYDAMNKGKSIASGNFLHYLNAGDFVWGEPYTDIHGDKLLGVKILDESGLLVGFDSIKLLGYGYCHQGIIFSKNHPDYDIKYGLASDFKLICQHFPLGLKFLNLSTTGGVVYTLGGVSTVKGNIGAWEIVEIALEQLKAYQSIKIIIILAVKAIIPRKYRRIILRFKSYKIYRNNA